MQPGKWSESDSHGLSSSDGVPIPRARQWDLRRALTRFSGSPAEGFSGQNKAERDAARARTKTLLVCSWHVVLFCWCSVKHKHQQLIKTTVVLVFAVTPIYFPNSQCVDCCKSCSLSGWCLHSRSRLFKPVCCVITWFRGIILLCVLSGDNTLASFSLSFPTSNIFFPLTPSVSHGLHPNGFVFLCLTRSSACFLAPDNASPVRLLTYRLPQTTLGNVETKLCMIL